MKQTSYTEDDNKRKPQQQDSLFTQAENKITHK